MNKANMYIHCISIRYKATDFLHIRTERLFLILILIKFNITELLDTDSIRICWKKSKLWIQSATIWDKYGFPLIMASNHCLSFTTARSVPRWLQIPAVCFHCGAWADALSLKGKIRDVYCQYNSGIQHQFLEHIQNWVWFPCWKP